MSQPTLQAGLLGEPQVRFALATGVQFVVIAVIVATRFVGVPGVGLELLTTVVLAIPLPARYGCALGVIGWALTTSFAVNSLGVLTFTPADMVRLTIFIAASLIAATTRATAATGTNPSHPSTTHAPGPATRRSNRE